MFDFPSVSTIEASGDLHPIYISPIIISKDKDLNLSVVLVNNIFPCDYLRNGEESSNALKRICKTLFEFNTPAELNSASWNIISEPLLIEQNNLTICYGVVIMEKVDLIEPFKWASLEELDNQKRILVTEIVRRI